MRHETPRAAGGRDSGGTGVVEEKYRVVSVVLVLLVGGGEGEFTRRNP